MSDQVNESTGLVTGQDLISGQHSGAVAQIFAETQAFIMLAKQFPRINNVSWGRMQEMCRRKTLATKAEYSYPRGGKAVSGASVYLARPLAQCWGNMQAGIRVISDSDEQFVLEGWAWDAETNYRLPLQKIIKKLIYRKARDGKPAGWYKPDERDLGELINREGAKLMRNAILGVIPTDFTEDAIAMCRETLAKDIKDPKSASKFLIKDFMDKYGVTVAQLNTYVGSEEWSPEQIVTLQIILNTINAGEAKSSSYFSTKKEPAKKPAKKMTIKEMKAGDSKKHQSVKGKVENKKAEPKKEEPPETEPPAEPDTMSEDVDKILELVKNNEAVMSGSLLKKCLKSNLEGMSPDGLRVVRIDVDEAITEAEKIAAAAK